MKAILLLTALLVSCPLKAQYTTDPGSAEVLIMGVFHFDNPQNDVIKTDQIDVMTPESQEYLEKLTDRLARFDPTVILLEFDPEEEEVIKGEYQKYLNGEFELEDDEMYQLGFRVGRKAGTTKVHSFDEREVQWDAQRLFAYMHEKDSLMQKRIQKLLVQITEEEEEAHANLNLHELLLRSNKPERDKLNKSLYILTNSVGAKDGFAGADASASWWHRNFRMYANIQKYARPGERVLVIGGQGHTAILRDFLELDLDRKAVDILEYLNPE